MFPLKVPPNVASLYTPPMNEKPSTTNVFSRGQSFYYALLQAPQTVQEACFVLRAVFQEINTLLEIIQEPTVAKAKLNWWREEIARTYQGQPQHPLSKQLLTLIDTFDLSEKPFEQFFTAAMIRLEGPHFDQWEDVQAHCRQMGGQPILLMTRCMQISHPNSEVFALLLGETLELIDRVRYFGKDLLQGKIFFAFDDLAFFNITTEALFTHQVSQDLIASLLYRQAHRARITYQRALEALPEQDRFKVVSLLNFAKIQLALLDEIEQANFAVLQQRICLTPVRKWWLAWRGYSQEKQRFQRLQKLINHKVTVHG